MWHSSSSPFIHLFFETIAYVVGVKIYWRYARLQAQPVWRDQLLLLAAAIFGALIGSKLLHIFEHLPFLLQRHNFELWLGGKSVLGGFIGGTLGVEIAKKSIAWSVSTGDAWVPALAWGLMIGRVGCQLSGLWDQTYGIATNLPWGWDYGDGIARHPTALYEIGCVAVALLLARMHVFQRYRGASFAIFLWLYCIIRFCLEYLKPPFGDAAVETFPTALYLGFTAIQWTALAGILGYGLLLRARMQNLHKFTIQKASHG